MIRRAVCFWCTFLFFYMCWNEGLRAGNVSAASSVQAIQAVVSDSQSKGTGKKTVQATESAKNTAKKAPSALSAKSTRKVKPFSTKQARRSKKKQPAAHVPSLPPFAIVRESCETEDPRRCLRRRCALQEPERELSYIRDLQKHLGDRWKPVYKTLRTMWEVMLYTAKTGKGDAFADMVSYPFLFVLKHWKTDRLWEEFTIRNKAEMKKVLPYIFSAWVKKDLFEEGGPRCDWIVTFPTSGRLFFCAGELHFKFRHNHCNKRLLYIDSIKINSVDFPNDIGKIRYELKRKGKRVDLGPKIYPLPPEEEGEAEKLNALLPLP